MAKACNPNMNQKILMDATNKEWRKCRTEFETIIRNQINQYFVVIPPIIRTANFFLPPGSSNPRSSEFSESSNSTNSQSRHANSSSSYLSNEEQNLAINVSAQRQALNLIKEAVTKHLSSLKRHAVSQAKLQEKKRRQLNKGIV
ncbi:21914_t:CDS:2, partial [Gigaspora rosea]